MEVIESIYPDLPCFMFGHSMGSFIARDFIAKYGNELSGVTICGTADVFPGTEEGIAALQKLIDEGHVDECDPSKTVELLSSLLPADDGGDRG